MKERAVAGADRLAEADNLTTRVVNMVRQGQASTRPDLRRVAGLGRTIVDERVAQAIRAGVLRDDDYVPSNGGRPSRRLRFRAEAGSIHAIDLGTWHVSVAVSDLDGRVLASTSRQRPAAESPYQTLTLALEGLSALARETGTKPVPWGIGMGMPGPVDFVQGRALGSGLTMTGWEEFDLRGWMAERAAAPFWVDNDLNLSVRLVWDASKAVAEEQNMILVKVSNGIGAGLLSAGRVHRGRHGAAGDIAHVAVRATDGPPQLCRCGKYDCLEAHAGGWALARDALVAARAGKSDFLARTLSDSGTLTVDDVVAGARQSDATSFELIERSATLIGEALAGHIAFFDPGVIYLSGVLPDFGDIYRAIVRRVVLQRTLPLTTDKLRIEHLRSGPDEGVRGAVSLVVERLFDPQEQQLWLTRVAQTADAESGSF